MNERIRKLAEQAFNEANNGSINNIKIPKEFVEKFAELIVRECMSCAQFVGITNDRIGLGPMPIRYTSMVNDQIKKHFGVEE